MNFSKGLPEYLAVYSRGPFPILGITPAKELRTRKMVQRAINAFSPAARGTTRSSPPSPLCLFSSNPMPSSATVSNSIRGLRSAIICALHHRNFHHFSERTRRLTAAELRLTEFPLYYRVPLESPLRERLNR